MATATPTNLCFTCGKVIGRVKCEGCSKVFCLNDFEGHQQELTKQLEEVEVTRDLFRQSLTEKITDSRKHPLIEQIDKWENESINKVRHTAEELRQILIKHTAELNIKLEDRLSKLTDQLRQSREAKDFFETELNQWKEELEQMKNELIKPSSVTIRQDPTALVTRINVKISDVTYDTQPNKKTQVTEKVDNSERLISCSFCNEKVSPSTIGEHLMMCGNKTDECPNCRTFVRRAILAYHRGNNCANPDTPATDVETRQQMQHSRKIQAAVQHPFSVENHEKRVNNPFEVKKNLLPNPKNVSKIQRPSISRSSNRSFDQSNEFDDNAHIPCESCNRAVPWFLYEDHIRVCRDEENEEIQQQPIIINRNTPPATNIAATATITNTAPCKWCGESIPSNVLAIHQLTCSTKHRRNKKE